MEARIVRLDTSYEVAFSRPAFSRIASFSQIIEPIYDAFSQEIQIPSDAIKLENGDTIATAGVTLTLLSGLHSFEAKLDGYKARFLDLRSPEAISQAKNYAKYFETAVCKFLTDAIPANRRLVTSCWLTVNGGMEVAENLIRSLTWLPEVPDPFGIGANRVHSPVKFDCSNRDERWNVGIFMDRSALPGTHLFLEFSANYKSGTQYDTLDRMREHVSSVVRSVIATLDLVVE